MPGRYVSDTTQQCVTSSRTILVPRKITVYVARSGLIPIGGATLDTTGGPVVVHGTGGGFTTSIPVTAGVPMKLTFSVPYISTSIIHLSLSETVLGQPALLTSTSIGVPSYHEIVVTPKTTTLTVKAEISGTFGTAPGGGLFSVDPIAWEATLYEPQNILTTICNEDKDRYPFGFNGQMKVNEIAGTGNWNTAEFWEYDTRTATRKNLDPKPNPSMSGYAVFGGNPIIYSDILGDSISTEIYDANGKLTDKIPDNVQESFQKEYGITLGYANGKLYKKGDYDNPESNISQTAKALWEGELGECNSDEKLVFGHNLGVNNSFEKQSVQWGFHANSKITFIDLGDFNGTSPNGVDFNFNDFKDTGPTEYGSFNYVGFVNSVPGRTFNLSRVIEHEFLGHGILGLSDRPNFNTPGPNEDNLSNPIRREIGLPERRDYGGSYLRFGATPKIGVTPNIKLNFDKVSKVDKFIKIP